MEEQHVVSVKKEKLLALLKRQENLAVAFSAGVDSTFLLKTAHDVLRDRVLAVTVKTITMPEREIQQAISFCKTLGVRQIVIDVDQMSIDNFANNPPDRCYHCKKALFSAISKASGKFGFQTLAEGTNADDAPNDRPGMRALRELGVCSPLREAGLTKNEIRVLSRDMGLPTWDKPSLACLATRIPFGEAITPQKLSVIDAAEFFLQNNGFRQVRVRMHGCLARIEVDPSEFHRMTETALLQSINCKFTELGFDYITLDLNGYASGSMNKTKSK